MNTYLLSTIDFQTDMFTFKTKSTFSTSVDEVQQIWISPPISIAYMREMDELNEELREIDAMKENRNTDDFFVPGNASTC